MKLSRYTLFVDDYPEIGKYLAYNTRTQGLVVLNRQLHSLLRSPSLAMETMDAETRPVMLQLQDLGLTVPDEADELDIVREWFEKIRYNSKKFEAYILTSYFCNFACPYCFEGKVKERQKYLVDKENTKS